MAKNLVVINDDRKRWSILHKFEDRQKALFLKRLSASKAMKMFGDLYRIAGKFGNSKQYKNIDINKINTLSRVHFMFNRVKLLDSEMNYWLNKYKRRTKTRNY